MLTPSVVVLLTALLQMIFGAGLAFGMGAPARCPGASPAQRCGLFWAKSLWNTTRLPLRNELGMPAINSSAYSALPYTVQFERGSMIERIANETRSIFSAYIAPSRRFSWMNKVLQPQCVHDQPRTTCRGYGQALRRRQLSVRPDSQVHPCPAAREEQRV